MITEPDVTLTDYAVAVECAALASLVWRRGDPGAPLRFWFTLFFGAVGLAALAGGSVHGFFLDEQTMGYRVLWPATLIAIGLAGLAAWAIGARIQFASRAASWMTVVAALEFVGYCALVILGTHAFWIAVLQYLPAAVFLLVVYLVAYRQRRSRALPPDPGDRPVPDVP